jgi:hypothetical protein
MQVVSIAFFNFFGVSVTKELSGGARAAIDACRTLFIWAFSLAVQWERFHALQVRACIFLFLSFHVVFLSVLTHVVVAAKGCGFHRAHHGNKPLQRVDAVVPSIVGGAAFTAPSRCP